MHRRPKSSVLRAFWANYCDFASHTGLHGVKYITEEGRRPWERVLWLAVVATGLVGAGLMSAAFYKRFSSSPTRNSVESSFYPTWRLPFPAATLCNVNVVFRSHAQALLDRLGAKGWERIQGWKALPIMVELVQPQPTNSSYRPGPVRAMEALLARHKMSLRQAMGELDQSCTQLLERCMWQGEVMRCEDLFEERKSFLGICCSFNYRGVIEATDQNGKNYLEIAPGKPRPARYYSYRNGLSVLLNPMIHDYYLPRLHSTGIRMLVHRVDDYPDAASEQRVLAAGREVLAGVAAKSSHCAEAARALAPAVRGCVFRDERRLRHFPVYSASSCLTECRIHHSALLCGCAPYYYHAVEGIRTCSFEDIPCLGKYYGALRSRRHNTESVEDAEASPTTEARGSISCDCPPLCNQVDYEAHVSVGDFKATRYHRSSLLKGANVTDRTLLHFYLSNSVSVRTKRDVVSSWSDLLSSLGGVFSLCTGLSVLSVCEAIYFFTARLARRYRQLAAPHPATDAHPDVDDAGDVRQKPNLISASQVTEFISQHGRQERAPIPSRVDTLGAAHTAIFPHWKSHT